jgi:glycine/D-amino acid oxidase-like deaminating enzyme
MKTYDAIIAGGGIIGGAIAFELARKKLRVLVIDRQSPGQEASWAAAGMLSPAPDNADAIPLVPLATASLKIYPEFVSAVESVSGMNAGFRPYGAIEILFGAGAEKKFCTSKTRRNWNLTSIAKFAPRLFCVMKRQLIIARLPAPFCARRN